MIFDKNGHTFKSYQLSELIKLKHDSPSEFQKELPIYQTEYLSDSEKLLFMLTYNNNIKKYEIRELCLKMKDFPDLYNKLGDLNILDFFTFFTCLKESNYNFIKSKTPFKLYEEIENILKDQGKIEYKTNDKLSINNLIYFKNYKIYMEINFNCTNLSLKNLQMRVNNFLKYCNLMVKYNYDVFEKLFNVYSIIEISPSTKIVKIFNQDIEFIYNMLLNKLNLDLFNEARLIIKLENSEKNFNFFKKFGNKITNSLQFNGFKLKFKYRYNSHDLIITNFLGTTFYINNSTDLNKFERILYCCNGYDNYTKNIRHLLLTLT